VRGKRREIRTNELLVLEQESFLLQSCAGWANITKVQITNKQIDIPMTQPTLIIYVTDTAIIIRQKLYLWQQSNSSNNIAINLIYVIKPPSSSVHSTLTDIIILYRPVLADTLPSINRILQTDSSFLYLASIAENVMRYLTFIYSLFFYLFVYFFVGTVTQKAHFDGSTNY